MVLKMIWLPCCRAQLASGSLAHESASARLEALQKKGVALAARSMELLSLSDASQRAQFIAAEAGSRGEGNAWITCMATLNQSVEEVGQKSSQGLVGGLSG